jgi:RNA polymerase sigma-70 factor (ECF subfamily)
LLTDFRAGKEAALEEVYRFYVGKVATVMRHGTLAGNDGRVFGAPVHEQHDLIQETFVRAFSQSVRLQYDGLRDYGPYLLTICRNLLIEYWRRRGREVDLPANVEDILNVGPADPAIDPAALEAVEAYVATLSPPLRLAYEKLYVACLSQNDAAIALGLSRQRVRTLEARIRKGLRLFLQKRTILSNQKRPRPV